MRINNPSEKKKGYRWLYWVIFIVIAILILDKLQPRQANKSNQTIEIAFTELKASQKEYVKYARLADEEQNANFMEAYGFDELRKNLTEYTATTAKCILGFILRDAVRGINQKIEEPTTTVKQKEQLFKYKMQLIQEHNNMVVIIATKVFPCIKK